MERLNFLYRWCMWKLCKPRQMTLPVAQKKSLWFNVWNSKLSLLEKDDKCQLNKMLKNNIARRMNKVRWKMVHINFVNCSAYNANIVI